MALANVSIPDVLLEELDRIAADRGITLDSLVVEVCERSLGPWRQQPDGRQWPDEFFSSRHLSAEDLEMLRQSAGEFLTETGRP